MEKETREYVVECEHITENVWWPAKNYVQDNGNNIGYFRVVRCDDCKWYDDESESCTQFQSLPYGDRVEVMTCRNGFCAWGEHVE